MNVRIRCHDTPQKTLLYPSVVELIIHDEIVTLMYDNDVLGEEIPLAAIFDLRVDIFGADP